MRFQFDFVAGTDLNEQAANMASFGIVVLCYAAYDPRTRMASMTVSGDPENVQRWSDKFYDGADVMELHKV